MWGAADIVPAAGFHMPAPHRHESNRATLPAIIHGKDLQSDAGVLQAVAEKATVKVFPSSRFCDALEAFRFPLDESTLTNHEADHV